MGLSGKNDGKILINFFSNFLGANFENVNYTSQIYMQYPYFAL